MNFAGWCLMLGSVGSILCLVTYCFYRVLSLPVTKDHLSPIPEADPDEVM